MRTTLPLPLLFLALPLGEIVVFGLVVEWLGFWVAFGLVLATSAIGLLIVRQQGFGLISKVSEISRSGLAPKGGVGGNLITMLAGLLLLIPGFITDLVGLLLLVPPVRRMLFGKATPFKAEVFSRGTYTESYSFHRDGEQNRSDDVVDLDRGDFQRNPSSAGRLGDRRGDDE